MATIMLEDTDYALDPNDTATWGTMLRDSAIAACQALFEGKSESEAMWAALTQVPDITTMDDLANNPDAFSLALLFMMSGTNLYCPDLSPYDSDVNSSAGSLALTNAWQDLIGGEPIDTSSVIFDGTWEVGAEVQPGTYRNGGGGTCYWARLSGFSGETEEILANGVSSEQQIVTIEDTDLGFMSDGCGQWYQIED